MNLFRKGEDKIKPEELRIEKLSKVHAEILKDFNSDEQDLVDFLIEDAFNQQDRRISATYLWFLRQTNELIAYITLTPDYVKLNNINSELSQKFKDKGINFKSLPALKICRLCVKNKYLKKGLGTLLIQFSINKAFILSLDVGCRFIYLDAKRNSDPKKDALHFYKKMGFEIYKNRNDRETPMYMDILPFIKTLADR